MAVREGDKNEKMARYIKCLLFFINVVGVLYLVGCLLFTTRRMGQFYQVRGFLERVESIPMSPIRTSVYAVLLLLCLLTTFLLREFVLKENQKLIFATIVVDILFIILLMVVLNFNYNGLVFWSVANVIYYTKGKNRYLFLLLSIVSYVGTDYQLLSLNYKLFSIKSYFEYYPAATQQMLLSFYNLIASCNIITFIILCVYVIQQQRGTIDQIHTLYDQLSASNEKLERANVELQELAIVKEKMGQTKERNRLAREIHDTLGHTLTGISAGLDACLTILDVSKEQTRKQLTVLAQVARDGITEVRRSVSELRPDSLKRFKLDAGIRKMIEDVKAVTKADIKYTCEIEPLKFSEDEENTIFRIIQESITNAIRHGKAKKIEVYIRWMEGKVHLTIQDDGIGCKEMKKGFGTTHMIERVHLLNGEITLSGENGFCVDAIIPIRWGEKYD